MVIMKARVRAAVLALALAGTGLAAWPAAAQSEDQDARIRKIEAEVRALQSKVFPGGDGRFFSPQVLAPDTTQTAPQAPPPATSAMTDVLGRLDSLEAQVARLTAHSEENSNELRQLKARLDAIAPIPQPAPAQPSGTIPAPSASGTVPAQMPAPAPVTTPVRTQVPAAVPAKPAGPSAERVAAVQAIVKPQTADPGDDEYTYGFRLWEAKFYPEAQQQLRLFLDKYPKHDRVSFARNLLGRAYLDDGKPREAAPWFLQNYQSDKQGARAPDSLLYLAESMIALKDTNRACIALSEFADTYPAIATGRLASQYDADRKKVKCN